MIMYNIDKFYKAFFTGEDDDIHIYMYMKVTSLPL